MAYEMNMSEEQRPTSKKLLPEGKRTLIIKSCKPEVSKNGNDMFVFEMEDEETSYIDKVYLVATPKKRWALKNLLDACGMEAAKDGVYTWDSEYILGRKIIGLFTHEDNEYINRNGEKVSAKQHRIVEFFKKE